MSGCGYEIDRCTAAIIDQNRSNGPMRIRFECDSACLSIVVQHLRSRGFNVKVRGTQLRISWQTPAATEPPIQTVSVFDFLHVLLKYLW